MGFSRYAIEKKQVSVDRGVTWVDVEPSETQRGQLLGTFRTLLECEDAACDLEEYRYELYDADRKDEYCGVKIPYGYAKIITFTGGIIICGVTPNSMGGCKITWDASHAVQYSKYLYENGIGYQVDIGKVHSKNSDGSAYGTCTAWEDYKSIELHGDAMEGLTEKNCCNCCNTSTCFRIDEFMPWVGNKVKRIMKRHYKRDHCSDEWYEDETYIPRDMGFGERWIPVQIGSSPMGKFWQHQLAVMENDEIVAWEDEGRILEYTGGTIIDTGGFDIVSELYNDGQYYIDMSSLSGSSVEYSFRIGDNPSGYAISTSSSSKQVTSADENTTLESTISGNNCKIFSNYNRQNISTDVYCISLLSSINTSSESGYRAFIPAVIKNTSVSGMVSTEFDIFLPLSNYQVRWTEAEDYYCYDYNKYKILTLEYSSNGTDWYPTEATKVGDIIERKSQDCGYEYFKVVVEPNEYHGINLVSCDGDTEITSAELPELTSEYTYSVTFGDCINKIGDSLFDSKGVTKITLQDTISQWGDNCFRNNENLTSTVSFSGTTSIGDRAFYNCPKVKFADFGNTLTSIGAQAFYACHNISAYTIPDSVLSVGYGAFANTYVDTQDETVMKQPRSCYIGTGITEIPNECFRMAAQIQSVNIPGNISRIGDYAFDHCYRLKSLTLNQGLEYIGENAFRQLCYVDHYYVNKWGEWPVYSGLTSVSIPSTVTEIGNGAFADCCKLSHIYMNSMHPPVIGTGVFTNVTIHIPPSADLEEWKTADGWTEYANMLTTNQ